MSSICSAMSMHLSIASWRLLHLASSHLLISRRVLLLVRCPRLPVTALSPRFSSRTLLPHRLLIRSLSDMTMQQKHRPWKALQRISFGYSLLRWRIRHRDSFPRLNRSARNLVLRQRRDCAIPKISQVRSPRSRSRSMATSRARRTIGGPSTLAPWRSSSRVHNPRATRP